MVACGGGSGHSASSRGGASTTIALATGSGSSPVTAPGGGGVPLQTTPSLPAAPTTTVAVPAEVGSAAAARQAFDAWLGAVVQRDVPTMLNRSIGAAAALGALKITADQIVASGGSRVSAEVTSSKLTPPRVEPTVVTFDGEVDVRTTVSGPKGTTPTQDRITGPVQVRNDAGTWKVANFTYDGAPLVYYPEGAEQTVNGVHLVVAFLLSNAATTNAVVRVYADSPNRTAVLQRVTLITASGATHDGRAFFGRGVPAGVVGFPRVDDRPARLDATFQSSAGLLTFSLPLPGVAS